MTVTGERDAVRRALSGRKALRVLLAPLVGAFAMYLVGVVSRTSDEFIPLIDGLLCLVAMWVPTVMAWYAVVRAGGRPDIVLAAGAVSCWVAGETYYVLRATQGEDVPLLSAADLGYSGFYVLMLAALVLIVRDRLRDMTWPVVLDSVIGALGAAAVLAVVLGPLVQSTLEGPRTVAAVLGTMYPLMDLVLVAIILGIAVTARFKIGDGWLLLVLGLITFTGADVAYVWLELNGLYVIGTPLDTAWAAGVGLVAAWALFQSRPSPAINRPELAVPAQAVPALATIAGLSVLITASQQPVTGAAVTFASATLALGAVPLVFRQRLWLSQARNQARTDELTGLPNRRAFNTDVPERFAADRRRLSAVLLLDLDKFKEINDGLGHDVGDLLLIQVAARLTGQLRPSDLLARMGGDEFVIHLENCGPGEARAVAEKLRAALADPCDLGGITVHVNASIGIACYPEQGQDLTLLLRKADMAMYTAKSTHSGLAVYAEGTSSHTQGHIHTVQALNEALLHDQLVLHFQPKINLATGEVQGVEALVRWEHPSLGLLRPDEFLRRFDEAGLLPALTMTVLSQALDQAAVWANHGRPLSVAVNLSASSIMDSRLPAQIAAMTSARGVPSSALVIEITEDVLLEDRNRAAVTLTALRDMGIRIAVDDFGKGYSSLSYLRDLPIDELKLDRSFIHTMMDDPRATALVVSTIDLAHSLGLEMTAEGVEDPETYRALTDYGCDLAQGFLMSKPEPAPVLDQWLTTRALLPSAAYDLTATLPVTEDNSAPSTP
jgi:diguanylate cyclase (GGDEF)-like protein